MRNFSSLLLFLMAVSSTCTAQTCYDSVKLPRIIAQSKDNKKAFMTAVTGYEPDNALFAAGGNELDDVNGE